MTNALIRSASFGALATMTAAAAGAQIKSVEDAVEQSTPIVDFRLRYENADEALFDNAANAITARLRLGFETGELFGTKFLVEFEHIEDFLDDFNSTINGNTEFPIIADPSSTELNRIQLSNTSLPDTKITAGRQVINLDDQRFVGDFDFRQNQQTFDALRVENSSFFGISANAIYLNQANRVFGEDSQFGRFEGDSVLLNAGGEIPFGRLTGFVYLIDIEEAGGALSTSTFGARYAGEHSLGPGDLDYALSYARQNDYRDNPIEYDADYVALKGGYTIAGVRAGAAYEVLGSGGQIGFSTPFGSLHEFQGYADVFVTTPAQGVVDLSGEFSIVSGPFGPADKLEFGAAYHDFSADSSEEDFGNELDILARAEFGKVGIEFKYADFNAQDFATDTRRIWFAFGFKY